MLFLQRFIILICFLHRFGPSWRCGGYVSTGVMLGFFSFRKKDPPKEEEEVVVPTDEDGDRNTEDDQSDIVYYVKLAKIAQMREEYDLADRHYHTALRVTAKKYRKEKISAKLNVQAKTYIYDGLADLALIQGRLGNAEELYKEALRGYLESGGGTLDNPVMDLTIKISSLYAIMKKDHEARVGLQSVIESQEKKVRDDPETDVDTYGLLGVALQTYGRFLIQHNELEKAESAFCRCEQVAAHAVGENSAQRLKVLNDLASVQILRTNYEKAEVTLQKALDIGTVIESPEMCALYSNLGAIALRLSNFDLAETRCKSALDLARKAKDEVGQKHAKFCLQKVKEARSLPVK